MEICRYIPKNFLLFVLAERKRMKELTLARFRRESFRDRLVKLLVGRIQLTTENEIDVLRYHYYILHGIDKIYVAPMDSTLVNKVR